MGMDISGKNARTEDGTYFRNNVWWWHPLADYIGRVAPHLYAKNEYWHSNDGGGLNASDSEELAQILKEEVSSGRAFRYECEYTAELKALPNVVCKWCDGTGTRGDAIGVSMGMVEKICPDTDDDNSPHPRAGQKGWCNACNGKGHERPFESSYPFNVENVQEFTRFLENCGGFEIW